MNSERKNSQQLTVLQSCLTCVFISFFYYGKIWEESSNLHIITSPFRKLSQTISQSCIIDNSCIFIKQCNGCDGAIDQGWIRSKTVWPLVWDVVERSRLIAIIENYVPFHSEGSGTSTCQPYWIYCSRQSKPTINHWEKIGIIICVK